MTGELRLAELLAGLSLVTDLAARHPTEQALRASVLATHLAEQMGLSDDEVSHALWGGGYSLLGAVTYLPLLCSPR